MVALAAAIKGSSVFTRTV